MAKTLIVEDNPFFRRVLKETLLSRFPKMDISEAGNAADALKEVETFTPDVIFVDIRLPGENGLELTRKIRSRDPDVPIIILTSYDLPEYREAAKEYQANHFLSKGSIHRENILTLVQTIFLEGNISLDH